MKKLFFTITVSFSLLINAQEGAIITMHAALVEGDLNAFEKVESVYMKKVAQHAADRGYILAWNLLKAVRLDGVNDEEQFNYMFVQSNKSVQDILDPKNMFWNLAEDVLSAEELSDLNNLRSKYTWTKDIHVVYRIESGLWFPSDPDAYKDAVIQFNFAKPKDKTGFIAENSSLWKPFFAANGPKMNMLSWGTGNKIHPTGDEWASVMTWDMFSSLADLFNYRLGDFSDNIEPPVRESNMNEINPGGFYQVATWRWMAGASAN